MTTATAPRVRRLCVRCGTARCHVDADGNVWFLCGPCYVDSVPERATAIREAPDNPRLWLVSVMGWKGGWPGFHEAASAA